jgi:hypothetical protein
MFVVSKTLRIKEVFISTVYKVLIKAGFLTYKRTVKPSLTKEQKDARLK